MRRVKINNTYKQIPDMWNDISVLQFQNSFLPVLSGDKTTDTIVRSILSIDLDKIADAKVLDEILECLEFFNTKIEPLHKPIIINDVEYELTIMDEISYIQAITIENIKKQNKFDVSTYISILLKPVNKPDFKFDKIDLELTQAVNKMPITQFYDSYIYFYTFMTSMSNTFKSLFKKKVLESLQAQK